MIGALVFDFDGLILDTETPLIEAWARVHERAGVAYTREYALGLVGHVDLDFDPWIAFGPDFDRMSLEREHKLISHAILHAQPILPGVVSLIETARAAGLHLAIASNSPRVWIDRHLERIGLDKHFDLIRSRDDVSQGKPAPEIYQNVLAAFGLDGREAVAFEDSLPGSLAAKAAGLWCVVAPNPSTQHHTFPHADWRVSSLAEVTLDSLRSRFG